MKRFIKKSIQIIVPILLGICVFIIVYRNMDFKQIFQIIKNGVKVEWIVFSFVFGILSNIIRGHRWQMMLQAIKQNPSLKNTTFAVFGLYFMNALIPRLGEFSRCQVLSQYEKIPFSESFGTVVSERIWDMLSMGLILLWGFAIQYDFYACFFASQLQLSSLFNKVFSFGWWPVIALLLLIACIGVLMKKKHLHQRFRVICENFISGVLSIRNLRHKTLFIIESALIWGCYFMQLYVCQFAFDFTADLTLLNAFTLYIMGSLGVLVPVPQGIGTWHFMVISTLVLFGVTSTNAAAFALLVHGTQTLLLIILGFISFIMLPLTNKKR